MTKYLDENGLLYVWQKIKTLLAGKSATTHDHSGVYQPVVSGKGLSTNDYTTTEKNKLAGFATADTYALKSDITNMYKYQGSVAGTANLPSTGNTAGDVYNVEASGMNYAWNGTAWDALGEIFTITSITNAEIDTVFAS